MNEKRGFTLIELMIVITIIIVLITLGVLAYNFVMRSSRDQRRMADLKIVERALEHVKSRDGYYPQGSEVDISTMTEVLKFVSGELGDPNSSYKYLYSAQPAGCNNTYVACSDFLLCAYREGSSIPINSECDSLACSADTSKRCGIGVSSL